MTAYLIADVEVLDMERFKLYLRDNPPTIFKHGGRFVVRGGATEVIEGEWQPGRMVVIEFPDMKALKGWYRSPEYQEIWKIRNSSTNSNVIFVEGA